jgi:hypothetical protein
MNRLKNQTLICICSAVCLALLTVAGPSAFAGTIGPDCGSGGCDGAIYGLTYAVGSSSGGNTTYQIFLTADTSGLTDLTGTAPYYIDAVAVQVFGGLKDVVSASLESAPGALGDWTLNAGGTNSGGCDGKGNFECAGANSMGAFNTVPTNTLLTWVFDITLPTGDLQTDAEIKAVYENSTGKFAGVQLSAPITLTPRTAPEPATWELMLVLVGAGVLVARKRQLA